MNTMQLTQKKISREAIKSRLMKTAAKLWGYQESEMESFDPLVGLLIGACANEFEKIGHDIHASHARVLGRLAQLMTPDVTTGPQAAHGIVQLNSIEAKSEIDNSLSLSFKKKHPSKIQAKKGKQKEVYFSPASRFPIFDAKLQFMACNNKLFQVNNAISKELIAEAAMGNALESLSMYLGIQINPQIDNLENINIYFDWPNDPNRQLHHQLLPFTQWYLQDHNIETAMGLPILKTENNSEEIEQLYQTYDISKKTEEYVNGLYAHHFIHLKDTPIEADSMVPYPSIFATVFGEDALGIFKEPLLWIKLVFPHSFPDNALENLYCGLNCFPIINRQKNKTIYSLKQNINIVPLETEDLFFNVELVEDTLGNHYRAASPLTRLVHFQSLTYSLRQGNIGRYDERNASETIGYLTELLRDESAAFSAMNRDWLHTEVKEMRQILARIEQRLSESKNRESIAYLIVKPKEKGDNVYIHFWTSCGDFANNIPLGSSLNLHNGNDVDKNNILLLSTTTGGRSRLNPSESLFAYKEAVLTRGRIVTPEDIKALCFARLGKQLQKVEIQKGIAISQEKQNGLIRTVEVLLYPSNHNPMDAQEWEAICIRLQSELQQAATVTYPFKVKIRGEE